jgi:GcrA cell cycle regulator
VVRLVRRPKVASVHGYRWTVPLGISVDVWYSVDEISGWLQPGECHTGIDAPSNPDVDQPIVGSRCIASPMGWDAEDVALLKKLWTAGRSAAQIARHLGYRRNAVCAKLIRLDLKRRHRQPTAKPTIRLEPKRRPALLPACSRPVAKIVSRKTVMLQPKEFTKRQLYAMLAICCARVAEPVACGRGNCRHGWILRTAIPSAMAVSVRNRECHELL